MMRCQKCQGRVFVDRVFSQKLHMELFCIMCGKRWMVNKDTNAFGRWLEQKDREYAKDLSISS
jgi:DNA-directed RNA polymerase subunit RPC12/RpoP